MPTYEYACKQCGEHVEVVQSFYDDPLTTCEHCGGELRKVFGNIGIVFKGSGFYKTDSRGSQPKSGASVVSSSDAKDTSASATAASGEVGTTTPSEKPASSATPPKDAPASTPSSSTKGSDSAA